MKKLLSMVLVFAMLFSFAVIAIADSGVALRKTSDVWYLDVTNGYVGTVTYQDNKDTFTKEVNGNGSYELGAQRGFTGQLVLVGDYGEADDEEVPYIVGTRTVITTTFEGYTASAAFLANQKYERGPKANYINAVITETYTVDTDVYDVWSNGDETFNEDKSSSTQKIVPIEGKSEALPNGSETNIVPAFANGLDGYGLIISYKGNGNKFNWKINVEPERETVIDKQDIVYFD